MKIFTLLITLFALTFSTVMLADTSRPTLTQTQLLSLQSAPLSPAFTLLDVRSSEEYSAGHIQGAVNISHDALNNQLNLLPQDKDQLLVVYCRSGRRAGVAEQILRENGYTRVTHLAGDMNGWQESNLPLVTK